MNFTKIESTPKPITLSLILLILTLLILSCTPPTALTPPTVTVRPSPLPTQTPSLLPTATIPPAPPTATPTEDARLKRVLLVTVTAGYYHASIPQAIAVIQQLANESGQFEVDLIDSLEGLGEISAERLASVDLLIFANTSGELPLDEAQKQAMLDFVSSGKGFMGTHSATDTFYEWAAYGDLIGAYFDSHPWVQEALIDVEDLTHPANEGLPASYELLEEYYTFRQNPRPHVHVLQSLNAASVNTIGDNPLVWCKSYGKGRVYYNALGHFDHTWLDTRFQSQLLGAMQWTAGLRDASCPVSTQSNVLYLPLMTRH